MEVAATEEGRAAAHAHTVWPSDYFVLIDTRNYENVRMRAQQRWATPSHLGFKLASKTLEPDDLGDSREAPGQLVMALKAWMLRRWAVDDGGFLRLRRSRLAARQLEETSRKNEIRNRGGLDALHPRARLRILERGAQCGAKVGFVRCRRWV